jgi:hypothetical protein
LAAEADGAGEANEPAEKPVPRKRKRRHLKALLWSLPGAVASAALGSYCGYVGLPGLTTAKTSNIQAFALCGMIFGFIALVLMALFSFAAFAPDEPAAGHKDAVRVRKEVKTEPEVIPYDFRADQRQRHRALIPAVPVTLALAAVSYLLINLSYPGIVAAQRTTPLDRLGIGAGGLLAFFTVLLVGGSFYLAWPARVYGPKRRPPPWVLPLKLAGYWLAMLPFSLFSLGAIGVGIYEGVNGSWVKLIIGLAIGLAFGAACCFLLAGSGALQGEELKPGGEVSEKVRKSSWWRHFRRMLTLWALFVTVATVGFAIQRDWSDSADSFTTACASWFARYKAGSGEMPEKTFEL